MSLGFFERRRRRKFIEHARHEARHARRLREDVASPESLKKLDDAERALVEAGETADEASFDALVDRLRDVLGEVQPARSHPHWRENLEIAVVALSVAMGFRTFYVQPFKIPTGSMQPTLYGITFVPEPHRSVMDVFPLNLARLALFGERHIDTLARASGPLEARYDQVYPDRVRFYVGGLPHDVVVSSLSYEQMQTLLKQVRPGERVVQEGEVLASVCRRLGDHIFVNRLAYNYRRPRRGDIFVFSTEGIDYPSIQHDTFYIKRLVGLPGETVSIDEPYLVIDGKRITEPYPFHRLLTARDKGYVGYKLASDRAPAPPRLSHPDARLPLSASQYLPMGDNTQSSLDGRYFGPVEREMVVGPAFAVYWPFSSRWGRAQ